MAHEAGKADLRSDIAEANGHFEQFRLLHYLFTGFEAAFKGGVA